MAEHSTKEKLIYAALDLFSRKGYSATSVDEIAGAIGIKGPNLYKYFKGKEDLYNELHHLTESEYFRNMGMAKETSVKITDAKALKEFSIKQLRFTLSNDTVRKLRKMCTIEQFRTERIGKLATYHQYTTIMELYKKIFSELMDSGVIEKCDVEILTLEYVSPISLLIQLCDREPDKLEEVITLAERFFDHFIGKYFN